MSEGVVNPRLPFPRPRPRLCWAFEDEDEDEEEGLRNRFSNELREPLRNPNVAATVPRYQNQNMIMMTRRQALQTTALATAAAAVVPSAIAQGVSGSGALWTYFALPPLPYAFDALEPHIDARTMEIHHDRHHKTYVDNLNNAVREFPDLFKKSIENLLKDLNSVPEKIRAAVRNSGGGHYNHSLFWQMIKKGGGQPPPPETDLRKAIVETFSGFGDFQKAFQDTAMKVFGSGWAWLVWNDGKLAIESSPNQDSPLSQGKQPLLGLDVWEHAYYLKYQNKRADYIAAWWNVVNWDFVAERYAKLKG